MFDPKERRPDIKKFCLNCGSEIQRKNFNGRIEDYEIYKKRKYCNHGCYVEMKRKVVKDPVTKPLPTTVSVAIDATLENLTPLEFMIREMNNPINDKRYRKEMAALAAPYIHPKLDSVKSTKKEDKAAKAGEVIKGARFGQSQPPRLVKQ